jgi:hypothetical protein
MFAPKKTNIEIVKKIVFKGLVLIIPLYILWFFYIERFPMYYNSPNNTRWYFISKTLKKEIIIPKSEILFLGDSRVNAGINFNNITGAYSFAAGGATCIEMYYILKKYTEQYHPPKSVYLSISPRFFSETYAFYSYAVRNKLLSFSDMKEISKIYEKNDTTLRRTPLINFILYRLNYPEYYQSDVMKNYVFAAYSENKKMINEMIDLKGGRFHTGLKDSCSDLNYETKYMHFIPSEIITVYFEKIINLCSEKNIEFCFFSMPMNESSYRKLNTNFLNEYTNFINEYKNNYPEFRISDSLYSMPDVFFGDDSHLNLRGKNYFTNEFLKTFENFR